MGAQADKQFQNRIERWRDAFCDEVTGIHKTIDDLIWNYAAFRTAIRVVYLANQRDREHSPINQMFFDLISDGYWSHLLLGTRRLLDNDCLKGGRGVNSVRAVLKDVRDCRLKLTRRVYIEIVRECRYDLAALEAERDSTLRQANGKLIGVDRSLTLTRSCHEDFDFLSATAANARSEDDIISEDILNKIEVRLQSLDHIGAHVNTHIAHSGNKESREGKLLEDFGIPEARNTLKELKQIADLVGVWFANEGGSGIPSYQANQFAGLARSLVAETDMAELESSWTLIEDDVDTWFIDKEKL